MQAYANFAVLVIPGALICNDQHPMQPLEIMGFAMWVLSYCWESLADQQKLSFLVAKAKAKERNVVCNVGLWKYSRHPNYFGEWMVWNSLIVMAVPSIQALKITFVERLGIYYTMFAISLAMFYCLVIWTGTKPAEASSAIKRPGYKKY